MSERKTGGQIIWESLMHEGVDVVFGITGGAILPTYDDLSKYNYPVHAITTTHEQGAAHMADGYARATGKVGVAMVTSGPGATNLITGLATAYMDSTAVVAITGQVPTSLLGRDGFQESDVFGISMPVTKHNYLITDIRDLPMALKEAFYIARTGRPGPVLVDICKDVQQDSMEFEYPTEVNLPGYHPNQNAPEPASVTRAVRLLNEAEKPLIVAGQGVSIAKAESELRQLAEVANIPVATSLLGVGTFPATHPLSVSWGGMHGAAHSNYAMQECDVMMAIGARLDDRLTGAFATFAPKARIIHVDLDPAEMGKNLTIDTPVVGDALLTLRAMLPKIQPSEHPTWLAQIDEWKAESNERDILSQEVDDLIAPQVMRELWHATNEGDCTVVSDVGQHQMWEAQYFLHTKRRSLLTSGGLGTMGYALPAAIGAQVGRPEEEMWVVAGDGGFQMTMPELSTVVQERLPIKIALINNGYLGMVRQWQDIFYNKRYSGTPLFNPDFVKVAEAYGIPGRAVTRKEDVYQAIKEAQATDGPFLLDFQVDELTNVFPMVAAGGSNVDMIRRPMPTTEVDE
jgi:acetolactate synthase-1/2/3 large subunit